VTAAAAAAEGRGDGCFLEKRRGGHVTGTETACRSSDDYGENDFDEHKPRT